MEGADTSQQQAWKKTQEQVNKKEAKIYSTKEDSVLQTQGDHSSNLFKRGGPSTSSKIHPNCQKKNWHTPKSSK